LCVRSPPCTEGTEHRKAPPDVGGATCHHRRLAIKAELYIDARSVIHAVTK
jgi:hypothetical protein